MSVPATDGEETFKKRSKRFLEKDQMILSKNLLNDVTSEDQTV
jgi:hypothetical protein